MQHIKFGLRFIYGRNNFYSSGQLPLDLVNSGQLDRFGYVDTSDGGHVMLGTLSAYYSRTYTKGDTFRADGFLGRSLFDLYSNFTFYLNDPVNGDAFQQHDSRLQQGSNAQYVHPHHFGSVLANLSGLNNGLNLFRNNPLQDTNLHNIQSVIQPKVVGDKVGLSTTLIFGVSLFLPFTTLLENLAKPL